MKPKFADQQAWQQAEILMQPAYIRLVDRIRRETEASDVQVSFEEVTEPYPSNLLCLQKDDRSLRVDIWDLCFQICFVNYEPLPMVADEQLVAIDTTLFDPDNGELDWTKLDAKAQSAVSQVFARFKLLEL
jgi:hypothetical protein